MTMQLIYLSPIQLLPMTNQVNEQSQGNSWVPQAWNFTTSYPGVGISMRHSQQFSRLRNTLQWITANNDDISCCRIFEVFPDLLNIYYIARILHIDLVSKKSIHRSWINAFTVLRLSIILCNPTVIKKRLKDTKFHVGKESFCRSAVRSALPNGTCVFRERCKNYDPQSNVLTTRSDGLLRWYGKRLT